MSDDIAFKSYPTMSIGDYLEGYESRKSGASREWSVDHEVSISYAPAQNHRIYPQGRKGSGRLQTAWNKSDPEETVLELCKTAEWMEEISPFANSLEKGKDTMQVDRGGISTHRRIFRLIRGYRILSRFKDALHRHLNESPL